MPGKDPCLDVGRLLLLQALELGHLHPHQQAHSPHREDPLGHPFKTMTFLKNKIIVKKNLRHISPLEQLYEFK